MNLQKIFNWLLLLFALFIIFQILRKIFGGSWGLEELVTALLVMNLGATLALHSRLIAVHLKIHKIDVKLSEHLGWHKGQERKNS